MGGRGVAAWVPAPRIPGAGKGWGNGTTMAMAIPPPICKHYITLQALTSTEPTRQQASSPQISTRAGCQAPSRGGTQSKGKCASPCSHDGPSQAMQGRWHARQTSPETQAPDPRDPCFDSSRQAVRAAPRNCEQSVEQGCWLARACCKSARAARAAGRYTAGRPPLSTCITLQDYLCKSRQG